MATRGALLGAIADDLTGATDLALTLSREGMRVTQSIGLPPVGTNFGEVDAIVVGLKTRSVAPAAAVAQSLKAAMLLEEQGVQQLFFKYCSTFNSTARGNIGPVAEALLAHAGGGVTIACPAFPATGRTVYRGHLFVGDVLLAESPLKDHPLNPMRDSNLVRLLEQQTVLPVHLIGYRIVSKGSAAIADAIRSCGFGIAVVDAVCDGDLRSIGAAVAGMRLVTGASGVAMGLPANLLRPERRSAGPVSQRFKVAKGRAVVLAGSTSEATRRQIAVGVKAGMPSLRIDPVAMAEGRTSVRDVFDFVVGAAEDGVPLVYSSAGRDEVSAAQQALGADRAGRMIETFLAELATQLVRAGFNRMLVAGGETSGAIVEAIGVTTLQIGPEIDPGVPWTRSTLITPGGRIDVALALKSGNFGSDEIFLNAWTLLL